MQYRPSAIVALSRHCEGPVSTQILVVVRRQMNKLIAGVATHVEPVLANHLYTETFMLDELV